MTSSATMAWKLSIHATLTSAIQIFFQFPAVPAVTPDGQGPEHRGGLLPDQIFDGIRHGGGVNGDERLLPDTVFPDEDLLVGALFVLADQLFQNFRRQLGGIHRQHQAVGCPDGPESCVDTTQGSAVGEVVRQSADVVKGGLVAGNVEIPDAKMPGLIQHMFQEGLSFIKQFRF